MIATAWLHGRRGQTLAVAITFVALATIWLGIVTPAWSWFEDRGARLEQQRTLLDHMRNVAASLPALRTASAGKHDAQDEAATIMLPGASDAVAAADLQVRVQKMASDGGASLTAVETLPPVQPTGRWHRVALRISLTAPWPVLMGLIRSIEQSPTRIMIDDIRFRSPITGGHPTEMPIQASMMLYGFRSADTPGGT